jgi:hypothetical protein
MIRGVDFRRSLRHCSLDRFAATQERSARDDMMHLVPLLNGHLEELGLRAVCRVVDEDAQSAESRIDFLEQSADPRDVGWRPGP